MFDILLLDATLAMTIYTFWKVDPLAGLLLLPCMAWMFLETALTISIWKANPKWRMGPDSKKK